MSLLTLHEEKHLAPSDETFPYCESLWPLLIDPCRIEPQDIYILKDKFITELPMKKEIRKYIEETVKKEMNKLKKKLLFTVEESLVNLWDNEEDDIWNDY